MGNVIANSTNTQRTAFWKEARPFATDAPKWLPYDQKPENAFGVRFSVFRSTECKKLARC